MESPFARKPESAVRARLSRQELCGEAIYELTRRGKIDEATFMKSTGKEYSAPLKGWCAYFVVWRGFSWFFVVLPWPAWFGKLF